MLDTTGKLVNNIDDNLVKNLEIPRLNILII